MIRHIVFWKLKGEAGQSDPKTVFQEFSKRTDYLKSIIPEIIEAQIATNLVEGFCICIDSTFESLQDLETYINHPEHLKVREYMNRVSCDKTVFDYIL